MEQNYYLIGSIYGSFVAATINPKEDTVDYAKIEAGLVKFADQIITENFYMMNRPA